MASDTEAIRSDWTTYHIAVADVERLKEELKRAEQSRDIALARLGRSLNLAEGSSRQIQAGDQAWIIHRHPNRMGCEHFEIEPVDAPVTLIL